MISKKKTILLICVLLAAATLTAFWRVNLGDFLLYDDPKYVTENGPVQGGFTVGGM